MPISIFRSAIMLDLFYLKPALNLGVVSGYNLSNLVLASSKKDDALLCF